MHDLKVTFYDARGVHVETFIGTPIQAAEEARQFIYLHGGDPDEDGKDAMPGKVTFEPVPHTRKTQEK